MLASRTAFTTTTSRRSDKNALATRWCSKKKLILASFLCFSEGVFGAGETDPWFPDPALSEEENLRRYMQWQEVLPGKRLNGFDPRSEALWKHNLGRTQALMLGSEKYSFTFEEVAVGSADAPSKNFDSKPMTPGGDLPKREMKFHVEKKGEAKRHPRVAGDEDDHMGTWHESEQGAANASTYVDDASVDSDVKKPITSAELAEVENFVAKKKVMKHSRGMWMAKEPYLDGLIAESEADGTELKDNLSHLLAGGGNVFGGWGLFVFDWYKNDADADRSSGASRDKNLPYDPLTPQGKARGGEAYFKDRVNNQLVKNAKLSTDDYKIPQLHISEMTPELESFFDVKVLRPRNNATTSTPHQKQTSRTYPSTTQVFASQKGGSSQIGHFSYKPNFVRDFVYDFDNGSKGTYVEFHPFPHFITAANDQSYVREIIGRRVGGVLYIVDLLLPFGYGLWVGRNVIHNDAACLGDVYIYFETQNGAENSALIKGPKGEVARVFEKLETDTNNDLTKLEKAWTEYAAKNADKLKKLGLGDPSHLRSGLFPGQMTQILANQARKHHKTLDKVNSTWTLATVLVWFFWSVALFFLTLFLELKLRFGSKIYCCLGTANEGVRSSFRKADSFLRSESTVSFLFRRSTSNLLRAESRTHSTALKTGERTESVTEMGAGGPSQKQKEQMRTISEDQQATLRTTSKSYDPTLAKTRSFERV